MGDGGDGEAPGGPAAGDLDLRQAVAGGHRQQRAQHPGDA